LLGVQENLPFSPLLVKTVTSLRSPDGPCLSVMVTGVVLSFVFHSSGYVVPVVTEVGNLVKKRVVD